MNEMRPVSEKTTLFAVEKGASAGKHPPPRHLLRVAITAAVLGIIVLAIIIGYLQQWLWMGQLGYAGIFWALLAAKWAMFCSAFVFAFLYLGINLRQAGKDCTALKTRVQGTEPGSFAGANDLARSVALLFAVNFYASWDTYLRFRHGGTVGVADPLFGVDVGFYLFHLPFYELLQSSLMVLTALTLVIALLTYMAFGLLGMGAGKKNAIGGNATAHLSVLLLILIANAGLGFYLDHYKLVYSTLGVVYGAGYAADHVTRIALWIMVAVSAAACMLLALNVFRRQFIPLLVGSGIYATIYPVGILVLPAAVQKFVVQPSELALETPYLKHYIDFTRKAYQLDAIHETSYPAWSGSWRGRWHGNILDTNIRAVPSLF
jgi:hypothetical protein